MQPALGLVGDLIKEVSQAGTRQAHAEEAARQERLIKSEQEAHAEEAARKERLIKSEQEHKERLLKNEQEHEERKERLLKDEQECKERLLKNEQEHKERLLKNGQEHKERSGNRQERASKDVQVGGAIDALAQQLMTQSDALVAERKSKQLLHEAGVAERTALRAENQEERTAHREERLVSQSSTCTQRLTTLCLLRCGGDP